MCDPCHSNGFCIIIDFIHNAVVAHPDSPFVVTALQLLATGWCRLDESRSIRGTMRVTICAGKLCNSLSALGKGNTIIIHSEVSLLLSALLLPFQRDPLFTLP